MTTSLVIHGHFYQPPRENPWTGAIDREPSAHPDHDWNERIHRECYRANAFARVFDEYGRVERILNNYAHLSFNFGPTLLSWLEHHDRDAYARILEADRTSLARLGHGNAIAQGFNHAILPLCNDRDRRTQIKWGIADFELRFGRRPESLWLPETACNRATLDALIEERMRYVILSPYQAERVRPLGGGGWSDVSGGTIDPGQPYLAFHGDGSGRSIAVFFYDGPISRSVAFEGSLTTSQAFIGRLGHARGGPDRLVHIATDGESYGHHTRHGERSLAHALAYEARSRGFEPTNYAAFLDRHPPRMEVEIKHGPNGEGTAWSCAHGVGRWYRDCGCSSGAREGWNQRWREPLRRALDVLRDHVAARFEETRGILFADPWAARDDFLAFARTDRGDDWLDRHAGRALRTDERVLALAHLGTQRSAQLMYTSCGWFFADISGIETVQIMKYAQRALCMLEEFDLESPREQFLDLLAEARSNLPEMGNGADVYRRFVEPLRIHPGRVAAHVAVTNLLDDWRPTGIAAGYQYRSQSVRKQRHGRLTLATAVIELDERATEKHYEFSVAAMHFGGVDFYCVARPFVGTHRLAAACARLWTNFRAASLPTILRIAQEEFGPDEYGLESLLPEGRRQISDIVLGDIVGNFADQYARLYENNQRVLDMLQNAGLELPPELLAAVEFTFSRKFEEAIGRAIHAHGRPGYGHALVIAEEAARRGYTLDHSVVEPMMTRMLAEVAAGAIADLSKDTVTHACSMAALARRLRLPNAQGRAQELIDHAFPLDTETPLAGVLRRGFGLVATRSDRSAPVIDLASYELSG